MLWILLLWQFGDWLHQVVMRCLLVELLQVPTLIGYSAVFVRQQSQTVHQNRPVMLVRSVRLALVPVLGSPDQHQ